MKSELSVYRDTDGSCSIWRGEKALAGGLSDEDALVMAAGPELLAALRAILLEGEYNDEGDFVIRRADAGETDTSEPPCLRDAGAAIAKAEGHS
jgi:hypothetical protein